VEFDVVYTNTAMVTPYRGAGRPHGAFVMERVIGLIARELSLEPAEVRRRNFIQPHEFPWDVGLTFQDGGPTRYDSATTPSVSSWLLERIGAGDFRRRQADARHKGGTSASGSAATWKARASGRTREPMSASSRAARSTWRPASPPRARVTKRRSPKSPRRARVRPADVTVVTGDTRKFNWGAGTFASRGLVTGGNAIGIAARKVREKALRIAAGLLEVSPDDLELRGRRRARPWSARHGAGTRGAGDGRKSDSLRLRQGGLGGGAAARQAAEGAVLTPGEEPGLEAMDTTRRPRRRSLAAVTGDRGGRHRDRDVKILRYVVQHDCGTVVNPTVVEGQIHGGVAQGIGGALYERIVYDDQGQPSPRPL